MKNLIIIIAFFAFSQTPIHAQLFIETGATAQLLTIRSEKSPALGAISELIRQSKGKPSVVFPNRVVLKSLSPKISIGYRIAFGDFNVMASVGTSQDFDNFFRLYSTVAVKGRNFPIPQAYSARIRAYQVFRSGLSIGGEFCYDNQKSEYLLSNSNLQTVTIGLLNQISSDINLIGTGASRFMQANALVGWQKSKGVFELSAFALVGKVGKSFGAQGDVKLRCFLGRR